MKNIKSYFQVSLLSLVAIFSFAVASPVASTAHAAGCQQRVLSFPVWYKGLKLNDKCDIESFALNDFWVIVLNFVEMLLQAVAYVSAGFILWGGFKYIKSQGDPGKISEAKMAIINAVIGLAIALTSVALVEFVQRGITQS